MVKAGGTESIGREVDEAVGMAPRAAFERAYRSVPPFANQKDGA